MHTSISDVFWIYFSDEEKWPDDITCSPYCSAARSIRHSIAARLRACARGGRTGLRARSAMLLRVLQVLAALLQTGPALRARPPMASPMPGRQSAREPPNDLLRAGDLHRQGEPGARKARDDDDARGEAGEQGSRRA